jgi:hypothetical protein
MEPQETKDAITDLLKRIEALEEYVTARKESQLSFPLDLTTQEIIRSL